MHESFAREDHVKIGTNRSFGLTIGSILALAAILNWWHMGRWWPWTGGTAILLLTSAFLGPNLLTPFNRAWFKFGLLLHRVTNPIVMALLFYGAVVPTGLFLRLTGKDLLGLRRRPDADSYWIPRDPPGPPASSMRDQF